MKNIGLNRLKRQAAAAAIGCTSLLLVAFPAAAESGGTAEPANAAQSTITVTGTAEKAVDPDYAKIIYSVTTQAETAADSQKQNDESVTKTLDLLKGLGIDEKSIATEFSMNPIYDWNSSDNRITGYQADTTITVSDVSVDDLGTIIAGSVESGVNSIQGISYYSSSFDEVYSECLTEAMKMARSKAETIAAADGRELSTLAFVSENWFDDSQRYVNKTVGGAYQESAASADMAADSVTVSPGQITVSAQLSASWNLQ